MTARLTVFFARAILFSLCLSLLNGCAVAVLGAGAAAAKVATDRRTVGTQLDDQTAETQISYRWSQSATLKDNARLRVDVHNGVALLTGQVPEASMTAAAEKVIKGLEHIRTVHNQIRVAPHADAATQAQDVWLATKIRTKLLADETVPGTQVKVIVESAEVFLMGRLTNAESTKAVDIARNVDGVKRVIRAFEILASP